ncbi:MULTISPECIES: epoxide hydrolase family protein [unclassified Microbacterium]|uniref:epoxide hydrolase family protein n=1 Tax=unclassified Microbacterium TaxID=2609290 RepID=UPI0012F8B49E|nr:epoxide hydrolase [Microbacterium sp. MAH-37]MVQ43570.1 alpha/beta fold hydrolase [Microbacterium sp. MAH-37]
MNAQQTDAVLPFRIEVSDEALDDLRARLRAARLPHPLPGDGWDRGVPVAVLAELVAGWAEHDWRATERRLAALPQIVTSVDGQTIHAVHVRSPHPGAVPVLLLHGWPGSFLEFEGLIGPLTEDAEMPFDVIIPSHPGFGFSTPLADDSWTAERTAAAYLELMTRLGYDRFAVQGGDHGAAVAPELGRLAPERVIGVHVNGSLGSFVGDLDEDAAAALTPVERDRLRRVGEFMQREFGYISIQSTRPGLIGAMAADSPVAQFAWIHDKLQAWTHPAEADAVDVLGERFVFDNASLYWFTASAGSAALVTYGLTTAWDAPKPSSGVPTAVIVFAHDVGLRFAEEPHHRIVRWTDVEDRGGHFAALEEPDTLLDDMRAFFGPLRG